MMGCLGVNNIEFNVYILFMDKDATWYGLMS